MRFQASRWTKRSSSVVTERRGFSPLIQWHSSYPILGNTAHMSGRSSEATPVAEWRLGKAVFKPRSSQACLYANWFGLESQTCSHQVAVILVSFGRAYEPSDKQGTYRSESGRKLITAVTLSVTEALDQSKTKSCRSRNSQNTYQLGVCWCLIRISEV